LKSAGIYLDYNSTTPVDPEVLNYMLPFFREKFGNASSKTHPFGWVAEETVEIAREQIARALGSEKSEIIFTSGATESANLAIKGVYESYARKGKHIIAYATEHKAVLDCFASLQKRGAEITLLPIDSEGLPDPDLLDRSIREDTVLVCAMMANNETGVIFPVKELSHIVHEKKSLFMCDATQAFGKVPLDVNDLGIDLMCLSSHKIYGPKGCGALYIRRRDPRVTLKAQIDGGGHERGLRSGTLNVPGIAGFGKAAELAMKNMHEGSAKIQELRDSLEAALMTIKNSFVNGRNAGRLPNTLNITFPGIRSAQLIKKLSHIAMATGSACSSALPEPSHVLMAMGLSEPEAYSSLRISLGKYTTREETGTAADSIIRAHEELIRSA
jgi:cysteine desulfurase